MLNLAKDNQFAIYLTNDFHSNVPYSIDLLEALVKRKKANTFIMDAGDFFEGSAFYSLFKGVPERKLLSRIYDIVIPGNHGFSDILELKRGRDSRLKILNANIYYKNKLFFRPYCITNICGYKVGVIGIISPEAFKSIERGKRDRFRVVDPVEILDGFIAKLRPKVDYLIVLSHSGIEYDKEIAKRFRCIDVIIGSHCHSSTFSCNLYGVKIRKAPELGRGIIQLFKNSNSKKIIDNTVKLKNTQKFFEEESLLFLNPYLKKYYLHFSKKIFYASKSFCLKTRNRKLLMDYLVKEIRSYYKVDMCIMNYSCLRSIFRHGVNTLEDIYNSVPFYNDLVKFNVSADTMANHIHSTDYGLRKFFCSSEKKGKHEEISVVTTSYLFNNIFNTDGNFTGVRVASLRKFILNLLKTRI